MNCNFKNGRSASTLLALAALVLSGNALAMGIDVGNKDVSLRWDNTVRYNRGRRVDERNSKIGNDAIADEGTYSFDQGDIVTNRLDLLSEMDFVYAGRYGVRASGAAWYDDAYSNGRSHSNPNVPLSQIPSYTGNEYSHHVKRYYRGPSAELLDAFAFGKFIVGVVPVSAKPGRFPEYWGDSLLFGGVVHGVAYAPLPPDLQK